MLLTVMRECRNFFVNTHESGDYVIQDGAIALRDDYIAGQYLLVTGSILSDGLYLLKDTLYTLDGASDEQFNGDIYGLRVPRDFISLCEEIKKYTESSAGKATGYVSESVVGLHAWTKATDKSGSPVGWEAVFAKRLNAYRKMFAAVNI